jgi:hypothetical protein
MLAIDGEALERALEAAFSAFIAEWHAGQLVVAFNLSLDRAS